MTDDRKTTPGMAEVSAKFVHKVDPVIDAIDRAISLDTKAQQAEGQEADQATGEAVAAEVKAVQTSAMSMGGLVAKARFVYRIEAEQAPSRGPVDESMAPKVAEHTRPLDAPFLLWSLLRNIEALAGATEDPILVLEREWHVRRERLHNEPDETDAVRDPLAKAATDVEFAIHRTPATTLEGVAVKLRLWARIAYPGWTAPAGQEWWKIPVADMRGLDHMPVASALQDLERMAGEGAPMTGATATKDDGLPPLDGETVVRIEELANEAIDLNQGIRRLLDHDLKEIPTTGEVLTFEIDRRLAKLINLLDGENGEARS